jgi:hypothetical protein
MTPVVGLDGGDLPQYEEYERSARREIAVVLLRPVGGGSDTG